MGMVTIRVDTATRDRLAAIARDDYGGVSLSVALERLIAEYKRARALDANERPRTNPRAEASARGLPEAT